MKLLAYLTLLGIIAASCTSSRINKAYKLGHLDEQATGILIQELASGKVVFQHHADQYFMPASNAKLLTFLQANRVLKDSIPSYRYLETADTLYFWGTGDPSLLHPNLHGDALLKKLKASNKVLVLADSDEHVRPLGSGWAWDDYSDDYSAEISSIPMYNNQVRITQKSGEKTISPAYFASNVNPGKGLYAKRAYHANQFEVPNIKNDFIEVIPFITSARQTAELLSYEINKPIYLQPKPFDGSSRLAYAGSVDSLFVPMLHDSDNQIAEQMLHLIAAQKNWVGPSNKIIEKLTQEDSLLKPLKWVDGSGLSRYNLMRPKDLVHILSQLKEEVSEERLFKLLPESGSTGTIRRMVLDDTRSRFYAKSGSFGNTYNLSGFYRDAKGKLYVFSIMTNLANHGNVNTRMNILWILNALR